LHDESRDASTLGRSSASPARLLLTYARRVACPCTFPRRCTTGTVWQSDIRRALCKHMDNNHLPQPSVGCQHQPPCLTLHGAWDTCCAMGLGCSWVASAAARLCGLHIHARARSVHRVRDSQHALNPARAPPFFPLLNPYLPAFMLLSVHVRFIPRGWGSPALPP